MNTVRMLSTADAGFDAALSELLHFDTDADTEVDRVAASILDDVKRRKDAALIEYTNRFDRLAIADAAKLEIPFAELMAALAGLASHERQALEEAALRIRRFHEHQRGEDWHISDADGSEFGQRVTPLDRVGIYVPGGSASYPSSVLMTAIPASVASVGEIIMVAPTPDGERNPMVLAAAALSGVHRVFCVGGAQAVAALAYGTETVPAVDKIVGPGNAYVAAAKRRVFGVVGIDMIAGPSEILVIADGSVKARWVAMDLFSQAEHGETSQAILLCPDANYIASIKAAIEEMLPSLPRQRIVEVAMRTRAALIQVADLGEACAIANRIAPEHLELAVKDPRALLPEIRHAGAIFLGAYSSEALGDYCAGPNHVLPTARTARFSSPLGVYDFQKRSSVIAVSQKGAQTLGRLAATLALAEGLEAHARSAAFRLDEGSSS